MAALTIFLHGLGSSSSTWDKFFEVIDADGDTSKIQEYVVGSNDFNSDAMYYYLYNYESKILGNGSIIDKIKESTSGRKTAGNITIDAHVDSLKSFFKLHSKKFHMVNIVAHSLGGVLAMKLLLKIDRDLANKVETVLLYGSPLKGSNDPDELKSYLGSNIPTNILQELSYNSESIIRLNEGIDERASYLNSNFRIFYIKSDGDNRIVEIDEEYFERLGVIESVKGGHSDIKEPISNNCQSFVYFKEFVFDYTKDKISQEKTKVDTIDRVNNATFSKDFSDFLQNVELLANAHPNKKRVTLKDIFIYPRVEKYYDISVSEKSIDSKILINELLSKKLLIAGEGQSGKTSLCKKIILELRAKS